MKFNYDPFENRELWAIQDVYVLEACMSWAEEAMNYGKKSRAAFD